MAIMIPLLSDRHSLRVTMCLMMSRMKLEMTLLFSKLLAPQQTSTVLSVVDDFVVGRETSYLPGHPLLFCTPFFAFYQV